MKFVFGRVLAMISLSVALYQEGCSGDDNKGGGGDCVSICAKSDALRCPNDQAGSCLSQCQTFDNTARCEAEWNAAKACWAAATPACVNGRTRFQGCEAQQDAYGNCLLSGDDGGTD